MVCRWKTFSNTNNIIEYGKRNPKTKKLVKVIKGKCTICGRDKPQFLLSKGHKHEVNNSNRKEDAKTVNVQLCLTLHFVI